MKTAYARRWARLQVSPPRLAMMMSRSANPMACQQATVGLTQLQRGPAS